MPDPVSSPSARLHDVHDAMRGKTIRLHWVDGPTKGQTQEHRFHTDGTVEWHSVRGDIPASASQDPEKVSAPVDGERSAYACFELAEDVYLVSYPAPSGYTLTMALNFGDNSTMGVAAKDQAWVPVRGELEVVH